MGRLPIISVAFGIPLLLLLLILLFLLGAPAIDAVAYDFGLT